MDRLEPQLVLPERGPKAAPRRVGLSSLCLSRVLLAPAGSDRVPEGAA